MKTIALVFLLAVSVTAQNTNTPTTVYRPAVTKEDNGGSGNLGLLGLLGLAGLYPLLKGKRTNETY